MKKIIQPIFGLAIAATMFACGGTEKNAEATDAKEEMIEEAVAETMNIKLDESNVMWSGEIIGGLKSHNGTLKITEGSLEMKGSEILGGSFKVDMKSINPTDSNYTADKPASMLVGHLSTGDFFLVDSFPSASFVIKSADLAAGTVTGDLTVRGVTKEETIKDVNVDVENGTATGSLIFNRQDYGVAFSTGAKDFVLSDEIELGISLKM